MGNDEGSVKWGSTWGNGEVSGMRYEDARVSRAEGERVEY